MQNWNISGIILEGISGSGKTAVLNALLKSERYTNRNYLSSLILSEHQTQRVLERKDREQGLVKQDNIELLQNHIDYISEINNRLSEMAWCDNKSTAMRFPYFLERFHLTHVVQYSHINWKDVKQFDEKLAILNCRLCILTIDRNSISERILSRQNTGWQEYIRRFGNNEHEITDHFVKQQNDLLELAEKSRLETLTIDTGTKEADETVDTLADFWNI
jgi:thymidylate kinase